MVFLMEPRTAPFYFSEALMGSCVPVVCFKEKRKPLPLKVGGATEQVGGDVGIRLEAV